MLYHHVDDYIAQGDQVVVVGECSWRYQATGRTVVTPKVDLIRFESGKIINIFELYDTALVRDCLQT